MLLSSYLVFLRGFMLGPLGASYFLDDVFFLSFRTVTVGKFNEPVYTLRICAPSWLGPDVRASFSSISLSCTHLFVRPIIWDTYGDSGHECWIKTKDISNHLLGFLMLIEFYLPLWISEILMVFFLCRIIRFVKLAVPQESAEIISRLKWYPLILLICWLPASVSRLISFFVDDRQITEILAYIHVVFSSMDGLLHVLVYGLTGPVRVVLKEQVFRCFSSPSEVQKEQELSAISKKAAMLSEYEIGRRDTFDGVLI